MVFRGKPSPACLPCRQKRITCDCSPLGCSSCKRAGTFCHGYRNVSQLRICDESRSVKKKGQNRTRGASPQVAGSQVQGSRWEACLSFGEGALKDEFLIDHAYDALNGALGTSSDDFAVMCCDFKYDFPLASVAETASRLHPSGPLMDCIKALGLSTFASTSNAAHLHAAAERYYLSALVGTKRALQDSKRSQSDEILLTVMIMTHVEIVLLFDRANFAGWSLHIEGELALVQLCGEAQLDSIAGRLLFMQVATSILAHSVCTDCPLPPFLCHFADLAMRQVAPGSPEHMMWTLYKARTTLVGIYHDYRTGASAGPSDTRRELLTMDHLVDATMTTRLEAAIHEEVIIAGHAMSSSDPALRDFLSSQCRTAVLCVRILLHLMILWITRQSLTTECDDSLDSICGNRALSTAALFQCQEAIISSIPKQIAFVTQQQKQACPMGTLNNFSPGKKNRFLSAQISLSNIVYVTAEKTLIYVLKSEPKPAWIVRDPRLLRLSHGIHLLSPLLMVAQVSAVGSDLHRRASDLIDGLEQRFDIRCGAHLRS